MYKTILNKDISIRDDLVIITEEMETRLDRNQLEMNLRDIQIQKSRLQEQNARIVEDYNRLMNEEIEIKDLISQLSSDDPIEKI